MKGRQIPFKKNLILGASLLLCAAVLGLFLLLSVRSLKSYDNKVSVRGLCEREVMADRAIYPITYTEVGNDLSSLYQIVNAKNEIIVDFLKENGFEDAEITIAPPKINDRRSNMYSNTADLVHRYGITSVVTLCTGKVEALLAMQPRQGQLMEKGIAIGSGNEWENPIIFEYTAWNSLKPEMIEEANENARAAAEQFARDSHSRLGKIAEASQGLFSIEPRDANTPYIKRIRVVNLVSYRLR